MNNHSPILPINNQLLNNARLFANNHNELSPRMLVMFSAAFDKPVMAKENIASIRGRLIDDFLHKTNPHKVFLSLMTNM